MNNQLYLEALTNRLNNKHLDQNTKSFLKGMEGEVIIEPILNQVNNLNYIHNLNLDLFNRIQIDFLIVDDHYVYHLEVKHYSGDYQIQDDQFINQYGNMFNTPFAQIHRANFEISQFMKHHKILRELKSILIFTHPTFTLKSPVPKNIHMMFPTELYKLQYMFKNFKTKENQQILSVFSENRADFSGIYNNIEKVPMKYVIPGLKCPKCKALNNLRLINKKKMLFCMECDSNWSRQYVYLYNLKELYICKREAFTLKEAEVWCGVSNTLTIRRVAEKYFKSVGKKPKKYYL
ncbi:nuclease-related domain-containing protein [Mammaliicoccus sp. Dog046]|uniref:nuclease-related domain-containing protein n=1 Tax=Mammaliicoccus sp. Dog046 TaxID=3034233 RepID=UPI002B25A90E|nr:nuclease-related domain-containing protein [Mammaliicoccus sp. Dog046]WQK86403.1 nuclease-related domain-containing protein [Mammaliicoccus sp. Dog046]